METSRHLKVRAMQASDQEAAFCISFPGYPIRNRVQYSVGTTTPCNAELEKSAPDPIDHHFPP